MSRICFSSNSSTMPDLIQTRFCMLFTSLGATFVRPGPFRQRNQRKPNQTRSGAALDFDNSLPDPQAVQKHFVAVIQEYGAFGRHDVVLVLQAQHDKGIAISQHVQRQQRRMLRNPHQPLSKASNFSKNILQTVSRLLFNLAPWKKIVDLLQKSDMPQLVGFALA